MLQVTVYKAAKLNLGIKEIPLARQMHVILSPLTTDMQMVLVVQYSFTPPPNIKLTFIGAVKSLIFDVVRLAIDAVLQSALVSTLVYPPWMVVPIDLGSYNNLDTYQP